VNDAPKSTRVEKRLVKLTIPSRRRSVIRAHDEAVEMRLHLICVSSLIVAAWATGCSSSSSSSTGTPVTGDVMDSGATDAAATVADAAPPATGDAEVVQPGCAANTGYAGDDRCLSAPPADQGFQLHYGGSFGDPSSLAPYMLQPNQETVDCYYLKTPNTSDVYVGGYEFSMRPGSHHLNINVNAQAQPDGFGTCQANDMSPGLLGGSETPTVDERTDPAPENQGLAVRLPANSQAVVNFHVINTSNVPMMREAWLNYYFMKPEDVKGFRGNVFLTGGLGFQITPGTNKTYTYACSPTRPVRILSLAAHMHVHATRMTAWKVTGGVPSVVYETYDWNHPTDLHYDSVHTNTPPDRAKGLPGGSTGQLVLQPTDTLQWECAVDNTSDVTLTFRNEVYTGEMCIMTGEMVPADDPMTPGDFVCTQN